MKQFLVGLGLALLVVGLAFTIGKRDDGVSTWVSIRCLAQSYDDLCYVDRYGIMRPPDDGRAYR